MDKVVVLFQLAKVPLKNIISITPVVDSPLSIIIKIMSSFPEAYGFISSAREGLQVTSKFTYLNIIFTRLVQSLSQKFLQSCNLSVPLTFLISFLSTLRGLSQKFLQS